MGLLSDDIYKNAKLRLQTAKVKGKKGRVLNYLEQRLVKAWERNQAVRKEAVKELRSRKVLWKQYNTRKKEFAADVYPFLTEEKLDFYLCHDSKAVNVTYKAARKNKSLFGFDIVEVTFANLWGFAPSFINLQRLKRLEKRAASADVLISGDPYLSRDFQSRHPKADPVLVLNGQEQDWKPPARGLRNRLNDTSDLPIVLYIGVLAPMRGIEQIIDAFALIETEALLAIIGPGAQSYRSELEQKLVDNKLDHIAKVLPGVAENEMVSVASTATIGISPVSQKVGNAGKIYNNKMFQYLTAQIPILSTNCPGPGGFVRDHEVGYIYEEDDAEDLARVIDMALKDDQKNKEIRANLIVQAKNYSWQSQKQKLLDYIKRVDS